ACSSDVRSLVSSSGWSASLTWTSAAIWTRQASCRRGPGLPHDILPLPLLLPDRILHNTADDKAVFALPLWASLSVCPLPHPAMDHRRDSSGLGCCVVVHQYIRLQPHRRILDASREMH